jgi:hypothetical protein
MRPRDWLKRAGAVLTQGAVAAGGAAVVVGATLEGGLVEAGKAAWSTAQTNPSRDAIAVAAASAFGIYVVGKLTRSPMPSQGGPPVAPE